MSYRIIETGQEGNLRVLLPNTSNPQFLSEEELLERGIEFFTPEVVIIERTLEEVKAEKLRTIKSTYAEIQNEGLDVSLGFKIDVDTESRNSILANKQLMDLAGVTETVFVDFDNNAHTISMQDYVTLIIESGVYLKGLFEKKQEYRDLINSYETVEEVDLFNWRVANYNEETLELIDYTYWSS